MRNAHARVVRGSAAQLRPWIEACWTGTARDPFPCDVLRSWRKNPAGVDPQALVPGVTRIGHGAFAFRFESWDGHAWRVRVESETFRGWHGFDLRETADGCELTHAIELELSGAARLIWPALIAPIHDWCVEAMLDRIESGLATGRVPEHTTRAMPRTARAAFWILNRARRAKRREAPHGHDDRA